jgi:tetratricopeptide (TPR) repeat protein
MRSESTQLDSEELMHLAMHTTNHEQAIEYLKRVLEISQNNAKAYYLLGAVHAQIGMYDRATQEMTKAVELDPNLPTAHFQLGLLHVTSGRVAEAERAWNPLDKLGDSDPLFLFKRGMLHLVNDEFDACIEDLNQGIALNKMNEALNNDMQKIVTQAEQARSAQTDSPSTTQEQPSSVGGRHLLLSAYQRNDETEH